jgi:hypothetical protein
MQKPVNISNGTLYSGTSDGITKIKIIKKNLPGLNRRVEEKK